MSRSPVLSVLFFVVKTVAIAVGGVLTVLSLMSVTGLAVASGWVRFGVAIVVAIAVPAFIADRLLPENAERGNGIVTDTFAVVWLAFALVVVGLLGGSLTNGVLSTEARRLYGSGWERTARMLAWVSGTASTDEDPEPTSGTTKPQESVIDASVVAVEADAGATPMAADAAAPTPSKSPQDAGIDAGTSGEVDPNAVISPSDLFKKWAPSVVAIQGRSGPFGASGGTGFVVDDIGIVVTNHHVIDGLQSVGVKHMDGEWASTVELLVSDEKLDIAVLKVEMKAKLKAVDLGDSDQVTVGEAAVSIGNPLGLEHTLTSGLISARRLTEGKKMLQMSTPVSPGNSGGPLFNAHGDVIGVTTAQVTDGYAGRAQNLNLAVPVNEVKPLLGQKKYEKRRRIGGGSPSGSGVW